MSATTTQTKRLALLRGPDHWWKNPHVRAFSYPGRLDVPRLAQALRLLVRRHSGLRVYFDPRDPVEVVRCEQPEHASWPLREMTAGDDVAAAEAEAHSWLQQQFSPYERPLLRALVLHRAHDDLLGLSTEQSILDHPGSTALFKDLTLVYDGLANQPESQFDELISDATRFARDERAWLASADAAKSLAWWDDLNQGLGAYPGLDLPEPPEVDTWAPYLRHDIKLTASDTRRLKQHAQSVRLTPTMLASAVTALTLRKHSHSDDVRFLFATSRRIWPGTESIVGYLSNRMMIRLPVAMTDTVVSLAPTVRKRILDAVQHSIFSHEEYVRARHPDAYEREPSCYGYLNTAVYGQPPQLDGLALIPESVPQHHRDFHQPGLALALLLFADGTGSADITCAHGMFSQAFIEEVVHDFVGSLVGEGPT